MTITLVMNSLEHCSAYSDYKGDDNYLFPHKKTMLLGGGVLQEQVRNRLTEFVLRRDFSDSRGHYSFTEIVTSLGWLLE